MKQFYFNLLFFIGFSFFITAQEEGGKPVEGLISFSITDNSNKNTTTASTNSVSQFSEMSEMQSMAVTTAPTGNSAEVGTTEGQLSVSLSGAATYNIPIMVPPGINGVIPQISLVYNSQGGNGLAGYGWNIGGISKITRIPSTKFHDEVIDGVDFDNLDRFALDGQRLIAKTGTYGANGTVYETENFSNVKITSYGIHPSGSAYGPSYFLVQYPDGSKAYYGNSTDSRNIMEYAITYWENPQSVRISYAYNNSNNNLMISSVNYGTLGSITAINKVQFNYSTSNRPEVSYVGGQKITLDKILSNIVVTGNSVGFRSYWMAYDSNSLGYQRLISITEKSGDGTKSYNPTIFNYTTTNDNLVYSGDLSTTVNISNVTNSNAATVSGDFYGDEHMEFLMYPTIGTQTKSVYWLFPDLSPGSPFNMGYEHNVGAFEDIFSVKWLTWNNKLWAKEGWAVAKKTDTNYTFTIYSSTSVSPIYHQYDRTVEFPTRSVGVPEDCNIKIVDKMFPKKILSGDFNGDGLTDVIAIDTNLYDYYSGESCDFTTITYTSKKVYFVDLKRDNTANYLTYSGELSAALSTNARLRVADFNGDGKSDFIVYEQDKATIYTLDNNNQLVLLWTLSEGNISVSPTDTRPMLLGDFNGDGKTDMIFPKNTGTTDWFTFTSTGNGFIKTVSTFNNLPYYGNNSTTAYTYLASDYDKDGKTDIIQIKSTRNTANTLGSINITCYKNINNTFNKNNFTSKTTQDQSDIYRDVLPVYITAENEIQHKEKPYNPNLEIACFSNNGIKYFYSEKDNVQEQLLRSITTGNGVKESITYQPLNSEINYENGFYSPIYNSSLSENYPNFNIESASSVQVVSMLEKQSATDYKKQLYSYYDAISNTEGLGFLGFKSTAKTNWFDDNNPIISTVSKFDPSLRGANIENYTVLGEYNASDYPAPSNFISKTTSTYTSSLSATKVFNLKLTKSEQFNGLDDTSSETSAITYDANNNPLSSTTYLKSGGTPQQTTITDLTYATPTSSPYYVVGRPTNKIQSVTASGDTMTSEEQYAYNTAGLLTQIKKKGHNTNFITEDNVYDTFGNITKKTISGTGFSPRETNYEYDSSGRFLTKSIDVEGLASTYSYNTMNGVLNSVTNPYGLTTTYLYDSWFKKTKTTDYLGKSNTYNYITISGKSKITTTGDDGSFSEENYDDLGRKITASVKDLNGNTSSVSYLYDIYDRNYKVSEPYNGGSPTQWNETQFDVYGRPIQNIAFTGKTTSISYSGLTTTVNDGTKTKTVTKNAIGNTVSLTDTPGGTITYTYFANGNLKSSDYGGVVTTIEKNGWGRKTKLTDPSAGEYNYTYNDLGEVLTESTPNGTTTYTLNAEGKPTQKTIVGTNTNSTTTYTYDGTTKLLLSSTFTDVLENNATTTTTYTYDSNKRLTNSVETTPYATFTKQLTYDAFGRLNTETSIASAAGKSSSKILQHTYKNGQPWQIIDTANSQVLWQTNTVDSRGQLTTATMANGNITITNTYDSYGFISETKQDRLIVNPGNIMTLGTVFDVQKGNLSSRTNSLFDWSESFTYDSLDRLTSFKNTAGVTENQAYDDKGRITQNAVGTYNYTNTSKAYQNTSVTLTPDALAHYTVNDQQDITYNAFKSPYQIEEVGKDKISFTYNDNNSRSTMFYGSMNTDKLLRPLRKYYSANGTMEIKHNITTGAVEFVTYIGGDGYTAPVVLKSDGTTQNYLYLQRDYQGSIVAISDATGQVLEKRLFDAWGNVLVQDGAGNTLNGLTLLDRGYTGHEHLQSVGLIHMNGRLYDSKLHRFLQPDNFVQDPTNTQNYNRYGYCWNNPLKFTDPSGEWIHILVGAIIGGVANWATHGFQFNAKGLGYFGVGAAAGALTAMTAGGVSSALAGGSFTAGALGTSTALSVGSGFMSGAVVGGAGGLVGGFSTGLGNALVDGKNIGDSLKYGIRDGALGAITGGIVGGVAGGIDAAMDGRNFWSGAGESVDYMEIPKNTISSDQYSSNSEMRADYNSNIGSRDGLTLSQVEKKLNTSVSLGNNNNLPKGWSIDGDGLITDGSRTAAGITYANYSGGASNKIISSQINIAPGLKGFNLNMRNMVFKHEFMHAWHLDRAFRGYNTYTERATSAYSYAYTKAYGENWISGIYKSAIGNYPNQYSWRNFNKIIPLWLK